VKLLVGRAGYEGEELVVADAHDVELGYAVGVALD